VPPGNPGGLRNAGDLASGRARSRAASAPVTARRRPGTGTRVLAERLAREAGADPAGIHGPEVDSHVDVALAVASGLADAGVCVRSAAVALGLEFLPLVWEPFDVALPADALPRAEPLLASLAEPAVARRAEKLGGYDLEGSGAIAPVR
jgi:molybdate-binding protein